MYHQIWHLGVALAAQTHPKSITLEAVRATVSNATAPTYDHLFRKQASNQFSGRECQIISQPSKAEVAGACAAYSVSVPHINASLSRRTGGSLNTLQVAALWHDQVARASTPCACLQAHSDSTGSNQPPEQS